MSQNPFLLAPERLIIRFSTNVAKALFIVASEQFIFSDSFFLVKVASITNSL